MQVQPYLYFDGKCEQAIEFYKQALGAKVEMLMHFKDCPDPTMITAGTENKVMHASFHVGDTRIMASDGQCGGNTNFQGFSLSIIVKDVAESERLFAAIGEGGNVQMPLMKTFFSPSFGMVADKFGVVWMVLVQ